MRRNFYLWFASDTLSVSAYSSSITSSSFVISGTMSEIGNIYCVVVANGSGQPTAQQIEQGLNSSGTDAIRFLVELSGNSFSFMFSGLESGVNYDVYLVGKVGSNYSGIVLVDVATVLSGGLDYLMNNAKVFYDFTLLTGAYDSVITTVDDQGPNGYDASNTSPAASPKTTLVHNGVNQFRAYSAFPSSGSKDVLLNSQVGNIFFKSDFEVWAVFYMTATNTLYDFDICGVGDGATDYFRLTLNTNQWNIQYRYSAGGGKFFFALSPATFFSAFPRGKTLLRFVMDFTNDICKLYINGVDISLTFNAGNEIATLNPANFSSPTSKLCIGGLNNAGTITARSFRHVQAAFAITPAMGNTQAVSVSDYLMNHTADG